MNNNDRRIYDHELIGTERTYRRPAGSPARNEDETRIVNDGMRVVIKAAYYDFDGVPGVDMLYVHCEQSGYGGVVTPAEVGWDRPLR